MIESVINKALDGNLDLVKKILEDLDLIYFSDEEQVKIQNIRKKFKVEPSYVVHATIDFNGALPIKYWKKDGTFINNEERIYVQRILEKNVHSGFVSGEIIQNDKIFWWEQL